MNKSALTLFFCFNTGVYLDAIPVVTQVGDLDFTYLSGSSESNFSASTLDIVTSKNSYVYAELPAVYFIEIGDTMTVSFSFALDNSLVDTESSFDFGFVDSDGSGAVPLGYDYGVQLDPVTTANGMQFREGDDGNLGKYSTDAAFATDTHTATLVVERTALDTYDLSFSSPSLSSTTRTVQNDIIPLGATEFDTIYFAFRGDAWNEDFGGSSAIMSISNFSINTTAIPEPRTYAFIFGSLCLLMLGRRCSR
ncbi:hypothetical protein SH580_17260 [Coraliomargarita algicola]|uniref:PEP-CTERM protein-sorting domain-containing protein n=1 Tax=Coraliomargarita algicola TaxID=3092156 RepID=A0ABZ0RJC0_9BACT|nr:hypothetical protein [Coraliomargarita sp. J2-16]WPJ95173.1 hypothetical protein SH580_17260 [Coraliomargarita sp. J2-16]